MSVSTESLFELTLDLTVVAGEVANLCDHAEHNEVADPAGIRASGEVLRTLACRAAGLANTSATQLYADRLAVIEKRNVVHHSGAFDGRTAALAAGSWRALQLVQVEHDRAYHVDVIGMPKSEQLRHYALHVAKIAGAAAATAKGVVALSDFIERRVADTLLFGIKLSTVTNEKLSDTPLELSDSTFEIQDLRDLAR